jgi:hypothetical protein
MKEINIIFEKVITLFTPILNFIKSPNGKYFIIVYLILMLISVYFLSQYRKEALIKKNTDFIQKNTNRSKAIETFNNYNKQIAEKLNQECSAAISNSIVYNQQQIETLPNKQGIFYFNNLERLLEEYISNNILSNIRDKKTLLDNYYLSLDNNLDSFVNKHFELITDIINSIMKMTPETIQELKYSNQQKIKEQIKKLNTAIKDEFVNEIQTELRRIMSFDETQNAVVIIETPIPGIITNEIHERLYVKFYKDLLENKTFTEFCKLRDDIKKLENELESAYRRSYDTITSKENVVTGLTEKITNKKREYAKTHQRYTLYLICLESFSNTIETKKLMKEELKKMSISTIQPANENTVDNIMSAKSRLYGKLSSTPKLLNDEENKTTIDQNDRIAENEIASKYSSANMDYEKDLAKMNGDTRIDPVSIFSNVERSAISFLEGVRGGNSNSVEVFKPRFDNDKAVRGTFLANDDMNLSGSKSNYARVDNSISGLKSKSKTNNSVIEGFEDGTTTTSGNTTSGNTTSGNSETINQDLLGNVGQQFYSISQNIMDNDMIKGVIGSIMKVLRLDNIQSSEQLGVLLVVVSALLFFIDLSS